MKRWRKSRELVVRFVSRICRAGMHFSVFCCITLALSVKRMGVKHEKGIEENNK